MLLFLRILPVLLALVTALGAMTMFWLPAYSLLTMVVALAVFFILLKFLVRRPWRGAEFWIFVGTPFFFVASSLVLLLFLESAGMKVLVITLSTFLVWLFSENLFIYQYLPNNYQVNALEYLASVINVVCVYFFTAALFALHVFLNLPLWLTAPFSALVFFVAIFSSLWLAKIGKERIWPNTLGGTVLFTELFIVFSFLPSGFFPSAALLTLIFYLFLGIVRAHLRGKLNKAVYQRYLLASAIFILMIIWTARWT